MSESLVGLITPWTRQESGRFGIGSSPGGVKGPAGMDCARVIVVSDSFRSAKLSQDVAGLRESPPRATQPFGLADRVPFADWIRVPPATPRTRSRKPRVLKANEAATASTIITIRAAPASI